MSSLRPHYLHNAIVIVSSRRVNWHASRLVYDDDVFVFVHDADRLGCYGWFMAVEGVRDDVTVLNFRCNGFDRFAIELDCALLNRFGVVFRCAIAKFTAEDVEDRSPAPSLFAPLLALLADTLC